ncbi:hypothetical protein [Rossellomorea marisflavi]|uniref:hypothetical protein n=1 Tax=Rossellomorea marisflavi TaxID=189381 RepID=UPI00064E6485|nr:hypothetical protein [Rossellomorea marisflavi]KML33330.1 hypothetical protein VL12_09870 [Rossellomorea marisflavi]MCM2590876.1 hypothetical protein [Rossellomorea marisflavi]USK91815.1 hypothetical protein LIT29_20425 [Rossellomorea marisflavi]VXC38298.1 conserved hypothetical protein [Bacillus sp. 349Y]
MERFEFNLSNRKVRLWLFVVIPILIVSLALYWVLPREYAFVPAIIQGGTVLVYVLSILRT